MKNLLNKINSIPNIFWAAIVIILIIIIIVPDKKDNNHDHSEAQMTNVDIWTCSMHPQIKFPKKGQCPICFMDLIPMESGGNDLNNNQIRMSENARKLAEIQSTKVIRKNVDKEIFLTGTIDYDETKIYHISAWTSGRLEKLYADYTGMEINKGDPLVQIYSPELFSIQEELIQAKKQYNIYKNQNSKLTESSKITLDATREKLRLLGLTKYQINQLEKNSIPKTKITINSPANGVIIKKQLNEGMFVKTGTQIYELADLSKLWIMLDVYEKDLSFIQLGQKVLLKVDVFPNDNIEGKIDFISPIVNGQTRSTKIRINLDNKLKKFKPGMFVEGKVFAQINSQENLKNDNKKHDTKPLVIPASSPLITGKRAVVFVRLTDKDEPTYETREIVLGPKTGDYYVVINGLEEGEYVVTSGSFKIDSAMQLEDKLSMMNPKDINYDEKFIVSKEFLISLTPLYNTYFNLRESLADDNFSESKNNLKLVYEKIDEIKPETDFELNALLKWRSINQQIKDNSKNHTNIENIEKIRVQFETICFAILDLEKYFGHSEDRPYYKAYCPMAFDDKGAPWLQDFKEIDNPYFGASMLRCGEIQKTLESVKYKEKIHDEE